MSFLDQREVGGARIDRYVRKKQLSDSWEPDLHRMHIPRDRRLESDGPSFVEKLRGREAIQPRRLYTRTTEMAPLRRSHPSKNSSLFGRGDVSVPFEASHPHPHTRPRRRSDILHDTPSSQSPFHNVRSPSSSGVRQTSHSTPLPIRQPPHHVDPSPRRLVRSVVQPQPQSPSQSASHSQSQSQSASSSFYDRFGTFERSLPHRPKFNPADLTTPHSHDRKRPCPAAPRTFIRDSATFSSHFQHLPTGPSGSSGSGSGSVLGSECFLDSIGEFDRQQQQQQQQSSGVDAPNDGRFNRKDVRYKLYGIESDCGDSRKVGSSEDHDHTVPQTRQQAEALVPRSYDRKCLKSRLYGGEEVSEEGDATAASAESSQLQQRPVSPRTRNTYGTLCTIRPSRQQGQVGSGSGFGPRKADAKSGPAPYQDETGKYCKKSLSARLYGQQPKFAPDPTPKRLQFHRRAHNPQEETREGLFRSLGEFEAQRIHKQQSSPSMVAGRREKALYRRRVFAVEERAERDRIASGKSADSGVLSSLGLREDLRRPTRRKNIDSRLYGDSLKRAPAKDFLAYQRSLEDGSRLPPESFFARSQQASHPESTEYGDWNQSGAQWSGNAGDLGNGSVPGRQTSQAGFSNRPGRHYDLES